MINQFALEGYVVQKPVIKQKFEVEGKDYVQFKILHYPSIGDPFRITCLCFNDKAKEYILNNIDSDQRVIVYGSFNLYCYLDPSGKKKSIPSMIVSVKDGVKLLSVPEKDEEFILQQKIGFPGGTVDLEEKQ